MDDFSQRSWKYRKRYLDGLGKLYGAEHGSAIEPPYLIKDKRSCSSEYIDNDNLKKLITDNI